MAKRISQGRVGSDVADVLNEHADLIEKLLEIVKPLMADESEAEEPADASKKTAGRKTPAKSEEPATAE